MTAPEVAFYCYSRCLYCGRRTPHEVCHEHWANAPVPEGDEEFGEALARLWHANYGLAPETCVAPDCPQVNT